MRVPRQAPPTSRATSFVFSTRAFLPAQFPQNCNDPGDLALFQTEVNNYCNNYSCNGVNDCNDLLGRATRAQNCAVARYNVNRACFAGGNAGHQNAANQASTAATFCRDRYNNRGCS
jgi:hypothetical protein